jgi:toxin FitB
MYLLDTCTISELVVKQPSPTVLDWFTQQPPESLYLSVVTIGEITKGIQKMPTSRRRLDLEIWLNHDLLVQFQSRIIDVDLAIITIWGELTGRLEIQGRRLPTIRFSHRRYHPSERVHTRHSQRKRFHRNRRNPDQPIHRIKVSIPPYCKSRSHTHL